MAWVASVNDILEVKMTRHMSRQVPRVKKSGGGNFYFFCLYTNMYVIKLSGLYVTDNDLVADNLNKNTSLMIMIQKVTWEVACKMDFTSFPVDTQVL